MHFPPINQANNTEEDSTHDCFLFSGQRHPNIRDVCKLSKFLAQPVKSYRLSMYVW